MEKIWKIKHNFAGNIVDSLFEARGLTEDKNTFLNPPSIDKLFDQIDWNLTGAVSLIKKHTAKGSSIYVYGDYDVDGMCATAILYKSLKEDLKYEKTFYYIPDRFDEGYGLSEESIDKIGCTDKNKLLITVDCGITADKACLYAKSQGYDVLITDHHAKPDKIPNPDVLLWTDLLTGAGIAFALSVELVGIKDEYLALAALATVADVQPLAGMNRSIVKYGLEKLNDGLNVGLKKLGNVAGIAQKKITPYEIGWILAPRLNSSGRLESALDSLKLLCTQDELEAEILAERLNQINYDRQKKTFETFNHARLGDFAERKLLFASSNQYHEGVIGLASGRLTQEFYRPSVVVAIGEEFSKGSARSVEGVNVIELLRSLGEDFYEKIGGHPMAAGFTVKTAKLAELAAKLENASNSIDDGLLKPSLNIDFELPSELISLDLLNDITQFEPFGYGNPEPLFVTRNLKVTDMGLVGSAGTHLKLKLTDGNGRYFSSIFFNGGGFLAKLKPLANVDLAYVLKRNEYNGNVKLDLQAKDIKLQN